MRRIEGPSDPGDVIEHGGIKIDRVGHRATAAGEALDLTPTEFKLLLAYCGNRAVPSTIHQLMEAAVGEGSIVLERTIDVHVKTLRQKIKKGWWAGGTDRDGSRVGYRLQETPASAV